MILVGKKPTDDTSRRTQKEKPGIGLIVGKKGGYDGEKAEQRSDREDRDPNIYVPGKGEIEKITVYGQQKSQGIETPGGNQTAYILLPLQGGG